ncbi:MAG: hypothetical protein KUA43_00845 [Hoeflea sp.]|uniref:hypothetical protein n=1 Tax=Hoeflea sp. TaxID=1940281 RepID=UPI001DCCDCEC|nr:hypothetical protein [Hoeflea sp.]MBU4530382.1 hypothetical protein [Alphaproteobacteria bacterium]MBU4545169.1 hypothetical protein [Alphaproteobacteria bacterium]MBU4549631.1 hypothetical protein [Alphaproteobacteria bacterium]MBV1721972.1 hypothetical protein [Hoeflea sp.]MBV1761322.1 hypothetical protein [Hoeflea sp.]
MQDYPPFANRDRRKRETHDINDTGASLWIAAAVVIAALVVIVTFNQVNLRNDGAPFLIVPPGQMSTPSGGLS